MKNEDNKDFITMFINFESKLKAQDQKSIDMTVKQIIELSTNPIIMDNLSFFLLAVSVRNLLVHNQESLIITKPFLEKFENLINKAFSIPIASQFMTKYQNMMFCHEQDIVNATIVAMKQKNISNVPILKDKKLLGVFSENTIFSLFLEDNGELIADLSCIKFEKIIHQLGTEDNPSQKFIFVSKDTDIFKLKEMFLPEVGSEKRVELAFVTNQGLKKEKILGLITIYDVMAQLPVF